MATVQLLIQPFAEKTIGEFLIEALSGVHGVFHSFQMSVAFAKKSGFQHIEEGLIHFLGKGKWVRIVVGVDLEGTTIDGLEALNYALGSSGELFINHDEDNFVTFHPKIYFFEGKEKALLIIGSGNLTQGGLFSNDEGFAILTLDLSDPEDLALVYQYQANFNMWCDEKTDTVRRVDKSFIEALKIGGYIQPEAMVPPGVNQPSAGQGGQGKGEPPLFGRMKGRKRPPQRKTQQKRKQTIKPSTAKVDSELEVAQQKNRGFVMTLMKTDVGTGQTNPGTSRRSPEIFIPLKARDTAPEFWGWKDKFSEDPSNPKKLDRRGVQMLVGGKVITVNMMTWPKKHDFRLRSEALRSAGEIGDLIKIEKLSGQKNFEYYVEIIPKNSNDYDYYLKICTNKTNNSSKMWGYF